MGKIFLITLVSMILTLATGSHAAEVTLRPDLKIPPYYKPGGSGCPRDAATVLVLRHRIIRRPIRN